MEDDYWEMGNLALENDTSAVEFDSGADSENHLNRIIQASDYHFDAKVERCEKVIKTLKQKLSLETLPFSIESYRYVEPTPVSTMGEVTDFSFQIVLHCNDNRSLFPGLLNYLHDILTENSEHSGICPLSINIVKNENIIRFKFKGDNGFLVSLCLAPAEMFDEGTGETQVSGQNF